MMFAEADMKGVATSLTLIVDGWLDVSLSTTPPNV
jgi:hypothetical protein